MKWFLCGFDFSPNRFFVFGGVSLVHERGIFCVGLDGFCSKYTDYRLVTEHFTFFFCVMGEGRNRLFRGEVSVRDSRHIVGKVAPLSFQSRGGT